MGKVQKIYQVNYFDGEEVGTISVHRSYNGAAKATEQLISQLDLKFEKIHKFYWQAVNPNNPEEVVEDIMIDEINLED